MKINNVEYFYNGKIYRLNGDFFNPELVLSYTQLLQIKYASFAERINNQNGRLEIHLSHNNSSITFDSSIMGIDQALVNDLNSFEASAP